MALATEFIFRLLTCAAVRPLASHKDEIPIQIPSLSSFSDSSSPPVAPLFFRMSYPSDGLPVAKEEGKLVYHRLHDLLEVRPHGLELAEVTEFVPQKGRPPTNGKIFAVHAVVLAPLGHSESRQIIQE